MVGGVADVPAGDVAVGVDALMVVATPSMVTTEPTGSPSTVYQYVSLPSMSLPGLGSVLVSVAVRYCDRSIVPSSAKVRSEGVASIASVAPSVTACTSTSMTCVLVAPSTPGMIAPVSSTS